MSSYRFALAPASPAPMPQAATTTARRFPLALALAVALPTLISLAGAAVLVSCPSAWDHGAGPHSPRLEARAA